MSGEAWEECHVACLSWDGLADAADLRRRVADAVDLHMSALVTLSCCDDETVRDGLEHFFIPTWQPTSNMLAITSCLLLTLVITLTRWQRSC